MLDFNYTEQILLQKAFISFNIYKYSSLIIPVTTLFTLTGNSLCILAFLINRHQWLKHHFYMFLMCFSDSFVLLHMLFVFIHVAINGFPADKIFVPFVSTETSICKFVLAFSLMGSSGSFTMTLCLAFDRLHALYYPFKYRVRTLSYAIKVGCVLTLINITLSLVFVVYINPYDVTVSHSTKFQFCWMNPKTTPLLVYFMFSCIYTIYYKGFVPICLLFILNICLIYKTVVIIKKSKSIKSSRDNSNKELKNVAFSSLTIILLSTFYIGCISPLSVVSILVNIREINRIYEDDYLHYIDQIALACNGWTAEILVS